MKLQNEETGQVENFCIDKDKICSCDRAFVYDSLKQLQEAGWKDYEKPKEIVDVRQSTADRAAVYIEMANAEEAEKAVEKLKALQRLKDKGFKFTDLSEGRAEFELDEEYSEFTYNGYDEGSEFYVNSEVNDDLETLFGVYI